MASQNAVNRDALREITNRGRVGGRNPISALCTMTGHNNIPGKVMVEKAVDDLVGQGKALVKKDDATGRIVEVIAVKPKRYVDRTELSPQAKRENMFAKGVPAHLPDEWCTPVVTSRINDADLTKVKVQPDATLAYSESEPYHVNLTTCLTALRQMADENGIASNTSVRSVLMLIENMTISRANKALAHLRGMQLYSTRMTGYAKSSYTVDVELPAITAEMVTTYRSKGRQRTEAKLDNTPAAVDNTVPVVDRPEETMLANIIESLEAQNADLTEQLDAAKAQSVKDTSTIADLRRQVSEHQQQRAALSPRLAEIVARYSKA